MKEIVGKKGLHIAIDGKAIKSARDKVNNGNVPYILDIGLSIGQIKVDDKSNEIVTIPSLLVLIDVKGKIITIDAIGRMDVYREENSNISTTKNYYILSQQFSTEKF